MTNAIRVVTLQLKDREVRLLYTNRALSEAEAELDKSILLTIQGFVNGKSGVTDIAALLKAGMEAGRREARISNKPITMNDAFEVMDEVGLTATAEAVMNAITGVLGYKEGEVPPDEKEDDPNA